MVAQVVVVTRCVHVSVGLEQYGDIGEDYLGGEEAVQTRRERRRWLARWMFRTWRVCWH